MIVYYFIFYIIDKSDVSDIWEVEICVFGFSKEVDLVIFLFEDESVCFVLLLLVWYEGKVVGYILFIWVIFKGEMDLLLMYIFVFLVVILEY